MAKEYTYYQSAQLPESKDTPLVPIVPSEMSEENTCGIGAKDAAIGLASGVGAFVATLPCSAFGLGSQFVVAGLSAACCTFFGRSTGSHCFEKGCSNEPMSNALG